METYLYAVGGWNLFGSLVMLGLLNDNIGNKLLVNWTGIFAKPFSLNFYGKLFLGWAIGLNIFFASINIFIAMEPGFVLKQIVVAADIIAYLGFIGLVIWGLIVGNLKSGGYVALLIFLGWVLWGGLSYQPC